MTAALEGGEWSAARPGRTLPPGKSRYPFYRRLVGPQGRSGRAEDLVPTGIRSRTVQPVVSRYTDWATRPPPHTHTHIYMCVCVCACVQLSLASLSITTLRRLEECRWSFPHLTQSKMYRSSALNSPIALPPEKELRYPLRRMLDISHNRARLDALEYLMFIWPCIIVIVEE